MNKAPREMTIGAKQRFIAAAGVILLLAAAVMAVSLNVGSVTAAWDSPPPGSKAAKKNQVQVTETVTVTRTAVSTATRTATTAPTRTATRTQVPQVSITPRPTGTVSKVSVCHRTGSQTNPYVLITISTSALAAHQQHGDLYPVPQGGCPQGTPKAKRTPRATNTPRPTVTAAIRSNNGNNGNGNANNGNNGNPNTKPNDSGNDKSNNGNNGKKGKP